MTRTEDKRRHPRVSHRLRVRSQDQGGVDLETIDLSAGGLSCDSPAFVAPMTKLALSLQLPSPAGNGGAVVEGEAVVVRSEPANRGGYRIALFFSRMDEEHRRRLQQFLESRMT
jgi:c-di-GMP-binding flagellar brake protein YcgR